MVQANSKIDLMRVEIEHFRREMEKEQHKNTGGANDLLPEDRTRLLEHTKMLREENEGLREDLKRYKNDCESVKKEEKRLKDEIEKIKTLNPGAFNHVGVIGDGKNVVNPTVMGSNLFTTAEEKTKLLKDLTEKQQELENLKKEHETLKVEYSKLDKAMKENESKLAQMKSESEKNYLEAERQKIAALSFKSRYDELFPKYEEMSRQQGYMQRHIMELESQNQSFLQRQSVTDQAYRNSLIPQGNLLQTGNLGFLPSPNNDPTNGLNHIQVPGRPSNQVDKYNQGFVYLS